MEHSVPERRAARGGRTGRPGPAGEEAPSDDDIGWPKQTQT
jgi:hypothetical protein